MERSGVEAGGELADSLREGAERVGAREVELAEVVETARRGLLKDAIGADEGQAALVAGGDEGRLEPPLVGEQRDRPAVG